VNTPVFNSQSDTSPTDFPSDHIKPKTGARIRDDFGQISVNTETNAPGNIVTTDRIITTKTYPEITEGICPDDVARNVLWRTTVTGSMITTQCPGKSSGVAIRECSYMGWGRPQLSECKSNWISEISANYRNGVSVKLLSNDLRQKITSFYTYGGDIISLFDLIESSIKNFQFHSFGSFPQDQNAINTQVLEDFSFVMSHLLEQRMLASWLDFSPIEFEFLRTRYIGILQDVGMGVLESSISETILTSDNFDLSVVSLAGIKENSGIIFGTDFSTIQIEVTQFLQTLTRNSPRLVLLEVSKIDTLFAINSVSQYVQLQTPGDRLNDKTEILSKIVSVFAKNVKNRFMPEGLNLTLKHLALQKGNPKACVHWDIHTNMWTKAGCSTISSNETHTTCLFNYLSSYAVVQVKEDKTSTKVVAILVASLTVIFGAASTVICCILCWKRIKVSF